MTYAPQTLLDTRKAYQKYTGLPNNAVGIVGDTNHNGGYHQGWDKRRLVDGVLKDYSWSESPRDWNHKTDAASAIDFGWFDKVINGKRVTLIDFNLWLVRQLDAGTPDTLDIRELIYTPDRKIVKRWDRLKKRTSGDSSHLSHSHCSRFRDAENKPLAPLVERFFTEFTKPVEPPKPVDPSGDTMTDLNPLLTAQIGNSEHFLQSFAWMKDIAEPMSNTAQHDLKYSNDFIVSYKKLLKDVAAMMATLDEIKSKLDGSFPSSATITGGNLTFGPPKE